MTSPQPPNNPQQMQTAAEDQSPVAAAAAMHFKREICDKELYKASANAGGEMDLSRLPQAAAETPYPYPQSAGSRQEQYDSPRQEYPSPREAYTGGLDRREQSFPIHHSQEYPVLHPAYTPRSKDGGYRSPHEVEGGVYHHHQHSPETRTDSRDGSCGPSSPAPPQPLTPHSPISQEESLEESSQPVYLSRNIVVYTKVSGDPQTLVDMHFSKAQHQQGTPMTARNLPPSFFNANYHAKATAASCGMAAAGTDLYGEYSLHHHLAAQAAQDPWQYAAQASGSYHRSAVQQVHDLYSRNAGYSALLLNRMPAVKTEMSEWYPSTSAGGSNHGGEYIHHSAAAAALDRGYSSAAAAQHYSNIHAGLDGSGGCTPGGGAGLEAKDNYWPPF